MNMNCYKYVSKKIGCLFVSSILLGLLGCNWEAPQQEESLPVSPSEILGFWTYKNDEGKCILDIREDGTYRQVCYYNGREKPFFDSGLQKWTFRPKSLISGTPAIRCEKMMAVSAFSKSGKFGKIWDINGIVVFKYTDGQVVLHSGDLDFKSPRPWGNWKRISRDKLPPHYWENVDKEN